MAYIYAKNIKEVKNKAKKRGLVITFIARNNKKFDLDGQHRYFYTSSIANLKTGKVISGRKIRFYNPKRF